MQYISNGWPEVCKKLPFELWNYWNYTDELSMEQGIILKSHCIIVPVTLQRKFQEPVHDGPQGIEKCLLQARESIFWLGITEQIQNTVTKCGACQSTSPAQKKLPLTTNEVPPFPWHTLGTDLFYWKHQDFLVVGDNLSKFLIVRKLPNSSTNAIVKELSMIFTEFGRPHILRSDNRPCHRSAKFQEFLQLHGVLHITSPYYHQSNGFAEAMVKIAKKMMKRSTKEGSPWNSGLLAYRTTPI